eukprot:1347605-Prymnesium_polylepis.2
MFARHYSARKALQLPQVAVQAPSQLLRASSLRQDASSVRLGMPARREPPSPSAVQRGGMEAHRVRRVVRVLARVPAAITASRAARATLLVSAVSLCEESNLALRLLRFTFPLRARRSRG